jgi:hypothetical protein
MVARKSKTLVTIWNARHPGVWGDFLWKNMGGEREITAKCTER